MIAYFDCFSGISGDMTLGALIDLGVPADWLKGMLAEKLHLRGFDLTTNKVDSSGIWARRVSVHADDSTERDYRAIHRLISESDLSARVIETSLSMFDRLAGAESEIHGCVKDEVHFHEVGGVDAIADMVGASLAVDYLGIEKIRASALPMGSGTVECRHGTLPVPAPATVALLRGVPVYDSGIRSELVTPTGAAIITALAEGYGEMPDMILGRVGYGAGRREFSGRPNVLRIMTGSSREEAAGSMMLLETCIDDMNPEIYGYLADRLFAEGAGDVCMFPVYMKKGRPGTMVQVLCERARQQDLINMILNESSAIGIRYYPVSRQVLERETVVVDTEYGPAEAKRVYTPDGGTRISPEYESCRRIAEEKNIAMQEIYRAVACGTVRRGDGRRPANNALTADFPDYRNK